MSTTRYLIADFETRSEADLKQVGAWEYALHPSTDILCVAWRLAPKLGLASAPIRCYTPARFVACDDSRELVTALLDPSVVCVAHNAFFEQAITRHVLPKYIPELRGRAIPHERWICTASLAAALALPRSLEGACAALRLPTQKDMDGRRLILKYCKPRRATKGNASKWHSDPTDLGRIMQYCRTDIAAETDLFLRLPPLTPMERTVWLLDQKINTRGFAVDRAFAKGAIALIAREQSAMLARVGQITDGVVGSVKQRDKTLAWLKWRGVRLPDLKAETVRLALAGKLPGVGALPAAARELLEIRQSLSKSSTAKYEAFERRSRSDGRLRGHLLYHGAATARWSGAGVQPQNFPRGALKPSEVEAAIRVVKETPDLLSLTHGSVMATLSSCLRGTIVASPGRKLYCADYAQIEARVLFWLARHEAGIRAFERGAQIYEAMAGVIYGREPSTIAKGSVERHVGKAAFLGCGYGLGHKKFKLTCETQGIVIDENTARRAVEAYRSMHAPVVVFWANMERATRAAVQNPGKRYTINRVTWWVEAGFLWCLLPSGRKLAYHSPTLEIAETPWGERRAVLHYSCVNPVSKKWMRETTYGGALVENITQSVARDLMAGAMVRAEARGYEVLITVHDELLCERVEARGSAGGPSGGEGARGSEDGAGELEALMAENPSWAGRLPIAVEGWVGARYRK